MAGKKETWILEIGPYTVEPAEEVALPPIMGKGTLDFLSVTFDSQTDLRLLIRRDKTKPFITLTDYLRPNLLHDLVGLTAPDKIYCHVWDTTNNNYGVTISHPIEFETELKISFLNKDPTTERTVKRGIYIYTLEEPQF